MSYVPLYRKYRPQTLEEPPRIIFAATEVHKVLDTSKVTVKPKPSPYIPPKNETEEIEQEIEETKQ